MAHNIYNFAFSLRRHAGPDGALQRAEAAGGPGEVLGADGLHESALQERKLAGVDFPNLGRAGLGLKVVRVAQDTGDLVALRYVAGNMRALNGFVLRPAHYLLEDLLALLGRRSASA